jgi:N-acyl homoserine lactone hydrolase
MTQPPIKVWIQYHGNMMCDYQWLVMKPERLANVRHRPQATWGPSPCHTVVVDHPDGRLLFDLACPRDWRERWSPIARDWFPYEDVTDEQYFEERLRQLKLAPSDFTYVVLSHLHMDHAGNLGLFKHTGAMIVVHKREYEAAMAVPDHAQGFYTKSDYNIDGLRWVQITQDTEIMDGVHLLEAPGHTCGTMCLMVHLRNTGTLIFTSDAVFTRESFGPPPIGGIVIWDSLGWLRSLERIRNFATQHNALVVFGHDLHQINELRLAPDAFYD